MELTHTFTVPLGIDEAFEVLTDIERIAPCMPGATIESVEGREFTGRVKVKVGPMQVTYRGRAEYEQLDTDTHTAVIVARGQETRGSGTANATVTATLAAQGVQTEVTVVSNLQVTGRPAQFGRGVMNDVGAKLLGQFADCLSETLTGADALDEIADDDTVELTSTGPAVTTNGSSADTSEQEITQAVGAAPPQPPSGAEPATAEPPRPVDAPVEATRPNGRPPRQTYTPPDNDAIDLFEVAGPPIARRIAPVAIVALLVWLLWRRRARRS